MIVLGINAYHADSSACIVVNNELIAAVEEERFTRIKHWAGFPSQSINYCLEEAGIKLEEVDFVAINSDPKANFWPKLKYVLIDRPSPSLVWSRLARRKERKSIQEELSLHFPNSKFYGAVEYIEHHLSHICSAHLASSFDESVTVSVDGFGDFSSGCWGLGSGRNITVDGRVLFPHSLGIFYQAFTQYLGFPNYGDEYKVMGLAPYGNPKYERQIEEVINCDENGAYKLNLKFFKHHKEPVELGNQLGSPLVAELFEASSIEDLISLPVRQNGDDLKQEHFDLAHSVQASYEKIFFKLLNHLHKKYQVNNLTLSGGCGNNSVANGKIYRNTPFKNIYIAASSGDGGGAIGAAFACNILQGKEKPKPMEHAYLGPSFRNTEIKNILDANQEKLESFKIKHLIEPELLCQKVASLIEQGKVIGWFQGRMEWGPRALGNRSILADPRNPNMKDIINSKIKKRESFRPFAPSILRDHVADWFEEDDDVPFMMQVFQIKDNKRKAIPAVTHVDGSGRLQTVTESSNRLYYQLIRTFFESTGVPILLNTSFNENEPVVCTPQQALDCFLRTSMDTIVLGNYIVSR